MSESEQYARGTVDNPDTGAVDRMLGSDNVTFKTYSLDYSRAAGPLPYLCPKHPDADVIRIVPRKRIRHDGAVLEVTTEREERAVCSECGRLLFTDKVST